MKIAVFGSGGIGGYFGARLAAAGGDVHFIARGGHLEAIRENGLRIESPLGDAHVDKARATDDPAAVGHADMVMVAVKLYDTDEAVRACQPLVGPDSTVASFQNGVTGGDALTAAFGPQRVIGGTAAIAAMISAPGVITHTGAIATIAFGEWDGIASPRTEALLKGFENAGVEATLSGDVNAAIWSKFVFLSSFSAITCALRLPIGPIREDPDHWSLFRRAMEETFAVARARGVAPGVGIVLGRIGSGLCLLLGGLVAAAVAFVMAFLSIALMIRWLRRAGFMPFVLYRLFLGAALLFWAA